MSVCAIFSPEILDAGSVKGLMGNRIGVKGQGSIHHSPQTTINANEVNVEPTINWSNEDEEGTRLPTEMLTNKASVQLLHQTVNKTKWGQGLLYRNVNQWTKCIVATQTR